MSRHTSPSTALRTGEALGDPPAGGVRRLREYNDDSECSSVITAESW